MSADPVEIFTDGACSGNPGPGGWGAILRWRGNEKELSGGEAETTNNRMELLAAITALESLKRPVAVKLHTDSVYLRDGVTKWIENWRRNGWKTAAKKPHFAGKAPKAKTAKKAAAKKAPSASGKPGKAAKASKPAKSTFRNRFSNLTGKMMSRPPIKKKA